MEKIKQEKKKNNKGSIIIISLLILVVLGLIGYICYDKGIIFESKDKEVKEENKTKKDNLVQDYDLEKAKELLIRYGFTGEEQPIRYLVGTIYEHGYDEQYKAYNAITNIQKTDLKTVTCQELVTDSTLKYEEYSGNLFIEDNKTKDFGGACYGEAKELISYDLVDAEYQALYGTNLEKKSYNFDTWPYLYSQKYDAFVLLSCECGGTFGPYIHIDEIKDAKLNENELTIRVYNQVFSPTDDNYTSFWLGDSKYNMNEKTEDAIKQDIITNHLDLIDLYEIKFEKKGENFIFKSLSQVLS